MKKIPLILLSLIGRESRSSYEKTLPKDPNKQLRLGVVGCGQVFERYHLPALKRSLNWKLVAVCEPLKERREWIQKSFQELSTFESFPTFLQKSYLDAVLITSPPATHSELAIQALEMGLNVLVEKPMALNSKEALLMLKASIRAQKQLWVGFNRRFRRPYLNLREELAAIPKDSIRAIYFELVFDPQNWKTVTPYLGEDSKGGGVLDDVASHQVDLLPWLLDQRVKEVKAEHSIRNGVKCVKYRLKFEDELVANCLAGHGRSYSENLEIQLEDRKLLTYPCGVLETRWMSPSLVRSYCQLKTASHLILHKLTQKPNFTLESFEKQFSSFAAVIQDEKGPFLGADAKSGVRSLQVIQACRESLEFGGSWKSLT